MLGSLALYQAGGSSDGKLHVIFCDVGQGDGILIKTPTNRYILIDSGPDRKILSCLAKHMPFWERTIDLVIITHPHADHFMGMNYVLERYSVTSFATEKLGNKAASFQEVMKQIKEKGIPVKYVVKGDRWVIGDVVISVLGPSREFLEKTSPNGMIGEGKEFASVVSEVSFGSAPIRQAQGKRDKSSGFHALFTGDTQVVGLLDATENLDYKDNPISVLQIPHHGSKTGLNDDIVQKLHPSLAVASVGQNSYGHPNKKILELLEKYHVPVLRTDKRGDVEVVSDGKDWKIN